MARKQEFIPRQLTTIKIVHEFDKRMNNAQ
jgi:hypothetical protein